LILSMNETGDAEKAEFPYLYLVDGEVDLFFEQENPAKDAKIKLDGFEIELPANKSTELIPGVTIDLKKAKPGEELSIEITEDVQKIGGKIGGLVESINNVLKFIKQQNTLDEKTDTSRTLGGDIILQTLESRIRSTIFKDIETQFGNFRVGDIGVSFQRDGTVKFDEEKFKTELEGNYDKVSQILTGHFKEGGIKTSGFIDNLNELANSSLRFPDGILQSRKKSLEGNIEGIDRRIKQRERMLEQKEKNLKDKFSRLEGTISRIRAQGAGVAGLGAGAPDVQQLG